MLFEFIRNDVGNIEFIFTFVTTSHLNKIIQDFSDKVYNDVGRGVIRLTSISQMKQLVTQVQSIETSQNCTIKKLFKERFLGTEIEDKITSEQQLYLTTQCPRLVFDYSYVWGVSFDDTQQASVALDILTGLMAGKDELSEEAVRQLNEYRQPWPPYGDPSWPDSIENAVFSWLKGEFDELPGYDEETIATAAGEDLTASEFFEIVLSVFNHGFATTKPGLSQKELEKMNLYSNIRLSRNPSEMECQILANLAKLNDGQSIYAIGKALVKENIELAVLFLQNVRPDDPNYRDAMSECFHFLRAEGRFKDAAYFAKQSREDFAAFDEKDNEISPETYLGKLEEAVIAEEQQLLEEAGVAEDQPGIPRVKRTSYKYSELTAIHGLNSSPAEEENLDEDYLFKLFNLK